MSDETKPEDLTVEELLARARQELETPSSPEELKKLLTVALPRVEGVLQEYSDMQMLYENTLDHSTSLENELSEKNDQITELMDKMKRYLSFELYDQIVHGRISDDRDSHHRQKLTIFFSDIVGFTDLTDSVEPEILADLLNDYLDRMSDICDKYGGTIDKYIGDAIMVYFGADGEKSEHEAAQSCVRMALEMQERMHEIRDIWKQKGINHHLEIRVGINTGYVTIGNFGSNKRMDYTIIGGQVNAASRLEHISSKGGILISGATYLLVKDLVEATFKGKLRVKGITHPIEVYEILGLQDLSKKENSYLDATKNGFELKPIQWHQSKSSQIERRQMIHALEKALEIIRTTEITQED